MELFVRHCFLVILLSLTAKGQIINPGSGLSAAPIFSTAVTGLSEATSGTNAVLTGPTTMTTPLTSGTYRLSFEIIQTAPGSGGTCTGGSISVSVGFKSADSGVVTPVGTIGNLAFHSLNSAATFAATILMTAASNGFPTDFISVPIEFRAASGTAIQYQVFQNTNSNCTTPPVFAVRPALYYMGY